MYKGADGDDESMFSDSEFEPDYDEESVESMGDDESMFSDSSQEGHQEKVMTHNNVAIRAIVYPTHYQ